MLALETKRKIYKLVSYNKAIANLVHITRWYQAVNKKLYNLDQYNIQTYKKVPKNQKVIGCKLMFKVKYIPDRSIEQYKVRLIVQDFSQVHRIDYIEIFLPTV